MWHKKIIGNQIRSDLVETSKALMPTRKQKSSTLVSYDFTYTHRYTAYLKNLKAHHWAYQQTNRLPGRNAYEKQAYWRETDAWNQASNAAEKS